MRPAFLYVGSRRKGPSSWSPPPAGGFGIGIHRFDCETGTVTAVGRVAPELSVGYLLHDARRSVLYALHEAMTLPDRKRGGGGMIAAFRVDPETGALTEISRSPSFGTLPCHATLDAEGRHLLVVHHTGHTPVTRTRKTAQGYEIVLEYDEAATVMFPLDNAGRIQPPCHVRSHDGRGALPDQTHSQLHCIRHLPGTELFAVCDKGGDRVTLLRQARETLHPVRDIPAPPGSSPRSCLTHPRLPVLYANFETAPLLHAYRWSADGEMQRIAAIAPWAPCAGPQPALMPSDMAISADGSRLYLLLRGPEALTTCLLHPDGRPEPIDTRPLHVENPRAVALSPDGAHLLVAAVVSQEVAVWPLNKDGLPVGEGRRQPCAHAGCMAFA
ncbi:lactonase family protein [Paracoccus thiocyanatus]|uniref:6-phosphogluconolactonase, cycloisomerase 2 family n=1 Tax=Paracoccus thiocyanatus TaxID=34006 RepID=A0A3D8P8F7_9RHOB|nr:beta-propeller fold lactonase family protein [Paracoccus thiocyanatus]RDW11922.1 hypothetical protein DIE28_16600 [Paracoccus thiocyanatus]